MAHLLVIDDDRTTHSLSNLLARRGHDLVTAGSGKEGLDRLIRERFDLVIFELHLPDINGIEVLRWIRRSSSADMPVIAVGRYPGTREVVTAMQFGASDVIERPVSEEVLTRSVQAALAPQVRLSRARTSATTSDDLEPHAAARWARAIVPIVHAQHDPKTLMGWSRLVYVSRGALRNWCRTVGLPARRALVFGRLLRAVILRRGGSHDLANLFDVVDRRTLSRLLISAGIDPTVFPRDVDEFLERQTLIRDSDALREIRKALESDCQLSGS